MKSLRFSLGTFVFTYSLMVMIWVLVNHFCDLELALHEKENITDSYEEKCYVQQLYSHYTKQYD